MDEEHQGAAEEERDAGEAEWDDEQLQEVFYGGPPEPSEAVEDGEEGELDTVHVIAGEVNFTPARTHKG